MASRKKIKTRYVDINTSKSGFTSKLSGGSKNYDFSDVKLLRNLLSNEKAKILHVLKTKSPKSIYALSKELDRDFKSVREDVKTLERFGFIEFHLEKTGKRESFMPVLTIDKLEIIINI